MDFGSFIMCGLALLTILRITDELLEQRRRETKTGEFEPEDARDDEE